MLPLLQPGLTATALHDYRFGQLLEARLSAHLHRGFGAVALNALEVYALPTPWLHQDPTTITRDGASEAGAQTRTPHSQSPECPVPPRPASGQSNEGQDDLKQGLLSLGVSRDGLPLRLGVRDGHTSDSPETAVAIAECVARGLDGVHGMVADRKAYGKRRLGLCLAQHGGFIT
jgi:hypothetical protein